VDPELGAAAHNSTVLDQTDERDRTSRFDMAYQHAGGGGVGAGADGARAVLASGVDGPQACTSSRAHEPAWYLEEMRPRRLIVSGGDASSEG